ncbi:MAG: DUF3365 domain-containing protein, partial [Flavobacteriales bacterium]|nr:DUF3365 domain-containing protein [Flavobacteriales bacterium]
MKEQVLKYGIILSIVTLVAMIPLIYLHINETVEAIAHQDSLDESAQIGETIKSIRHLYTSEVVDAAENIGGMTITHDYRDNRYDSLGGAIPLPATFSMDIADAMSNEETTIKLYSKYPFPLRANRKLTAFESDAWDHFISTSNKDEPYYKFDEENNLLYYAMADKMVHSSCVQCHNTHSDSPKTDWKLNDVRGVISITQPLHNKVILQSSNSTTFWLLSILFTCGAAIIIMVVATSNISKRKISTAHERVKTTLKNLQHTQSQLVQSERMASIGQLTAGIAHEINNPINFIN